MVSFFASTQVVAVLVLVSFPLTACGGVADVVAAVSMLKMNTSSALPPNTSEANKLNLTADNFEGMEALQSFGASSPNMTENVTSASSTRNYGARSSAPDANVNTTLASAFFGMPMPFNIPINIPFLNGAQRPTSTSQYNVAEATLFARISTSTYCQRPIPEMTDTRMLNGGGMLAMVGRADSRCVVAFRGTNNDANVVQDISSGLVLTQLAGCSGCRVGVGFLQAYHEVQMGVKRALQDLQCSRVSVTGHSLGAAVAILTLYDLSVSRFNLEASYTFGQPRVGDAAFVAAWTAHLQSVKVYRFVHGLDPVVPLGPMIPGSVAHVGTEIYLPGSNMALDHYCYLGVSMGSGCGKPCNPLP